MSEKETKLVIAAANREGFEGPIQGWRIVGNHVEMWDLHGRHLETELVPEEKVIILEMEPSEFDIIMPEPEPKRRGRSRPARKEK